MLKWVGFRAKYLKKIGEKMQGLEELYRKNIPIIKENIRGVVLRAVCSFFLFTSFGGGSILMGSIFDQLQLRNLGQLKNFALYIAFSMGTFFSNIMVSK